ncbi:MULTISPECIES: YfjI family protein [unclassified Colwellia]|uniref:YfjI family protein n=1 Tax=unclassified Colwellia TaxID=196834 RepID=UPI0015F4FF02|nr:MULTISPECIES: YfjI family protein [unclassified Colwellia]MBA6257447.1 DUF3987 domain-containing protein [Colwellia sp. MB3u-28]MBA6260519.1 DUF3987 domain-containing protein [Colwellia sp. MB3u-41]
MENIITASTVSPIKTIPLPNGKPYVIPFDYSLLPLELKSFVRDTAERHQSPPDFLAVAALGALAAVLGNKVHICPKQHDNWKVTPNLWALIIGPPSAMKTPSIKEAVKPLTNIEKGYQELHAEEQLKFKVDSSVAKISIKAAEARAFNLLKGKEEDKKSQAEEIIAEANTDEVEPPTLKRIVINDTTIEKLGDLLAQNRNGLLLVRDEISGLLSKLAKEEYQTDRAFYLECFDGDATYKVDRIMRGTIIIENCTLSLIGGIQPSKLAPLIRGAANGTSDDGLIQRLQLAVWPDQIKNWQWRDKKPDESAWQAYKASFTSLHNYNPVIKAHHFSDEAQQLFITWMEEIQRKARNDETSAIMSSYLMKLPKSITAIALIFHIIKTNKDSSTAQPSNQVSVEAIAMALDWADYLISHANRIYSWANNFSIEIAKLIYKRRKKLPVPFKARDITNTGWSGVGSTKDIYEALELLVDHNYLTEQQSVIGASGGRPSRVFYWSSAVEDM